MQLVEKKWEFKTDGVAARRGLLIHGEKTPKYTFVIKKI